MLNPQNIESVDRVCVRGIDCLHICFRSNDGTPSGGVVLPIAQATVLRAAVEWHEKHAAETESELEEFAQALADAVEGR